MFEDFFSNKCQAFVGEDGRMLTGKALEAAKLDPKAHRCGNRIPLRAKYCNKCGSPAPGAWWRCGACGKWVGVESNACPHCGHKLDYATQLSVDNGLWRKGDDVFAQLFELNDVAPMFRNGMDIQEGQCAILLLNGKKVDVLPPGHYSASELVDLEEYARSGERKSLVMVDIAELAFPILLTGLRSKEDLDLNLGCRVLVAFDHALAGNFLANVLANREFINERDSTTCIRYEAIARNLLLVEAELAARDICNAHTIDELFRDPMLRNSLEDAMRGRLEKGLAAAGLRFVRLADVEFHGGIYDRLREQSGEVEKNRRELEFHYRINELLADKTKRDALGEAQLDDYLEQLALDRELKDIERAEAFARVREAFDRDRKLADLENRYQLAKKEQSDTHELERLDAWHDEELKKLQKSGELERRRMEHDELIRQKTAELNAYNMQEQVNLSLWKMRRQAEMEMKQQEQELEEKSKRSDMDLLKMRAEIMSGLDIFAQIQMTDDPIKMHYLSKTYKAQLRSSMDATRYLAEEALNGNTTAIQCLQEMPKAQMSALLQQWRQSDNDRNKEAMDRIERIVKMFIDAPRPQPPVNTTTTQIIK